MVGPDDGGFGFDQSKKYSSVDNLDKICVQCQAGQHKKCLAKSKEQSSCGCGVSINFDLEQVKVDESKIFAIEL